MFQRLVTGALIAGFSAGLIAAALQYFFMQPILLAAEMVEAGGQLSTALPQPAFDPLRNGLTVVFSALTYTGYGLILLAFMAANAMSGTQITAKTGLIWGLCGWIAVQLAPALGTPPELPGMLGADLDQRQIWWFATAFLTGLGLWLILARQGWVMLTAGIALIALPHLVGAPDPALSQTGLAPELAALFVARSLGISLVAWVNLGAIAGAIWERDAT